MRAFLVLLSIASAHLYVRVRQTIVAALGVTIGVGFFLAVSSVMVGSEKDFVRALIDSAPHIVVRDEQRATARQPARDAFPGAAVDIRGVRPQDEVRGLKDWTGMLADARAVPGAVAGPSLSGAITIRFAGRTEGAALNGIDPDIQGKLANIEETLTGGVLRDLERRPDGIFISRPLADRLGAKLGDTLIVSSSAGILQRMRILGLIEPNATAGFYAGDTSTYGLLRTAQVLFGRPNIVNQVQIKLTNPDAAREIAAMLERRWGYTWESWQERSEDILDLLVVRSVSTYVVVSAILLVASFGIYTSVSTSVNDKRRDIAILRAMGFTRGDVQTVFVIEGLAVAVIGALLGFVLGAALMEFIASARFKLQGQEFAIPLDRGAAQYAVAGAVSLGSATFAAWLPARKAAQVDPVDILRGAA